MPNANNILEWIEIGKVCTYLAASDVKKQTFLGTNVMDKLQAEKIYLVNDSVEWGYTYDNNTAALDLVNDYQIALCGKYTAAARAIISGSSGGSTVVVIGDGNTCYTVAWNKVQLVIGDPAAAIPTGFTTPNAGDNTVIIPYGVMPNSETIFYQGIFVKKNPSDDFNYTPFYNGTTDTTYVFSQVFEDGFSLEFNIAQILSVGNCGGGSATGGTGLLSVVFTVTADGNTITVPQLANGAVFVLAIKGMQPLDTTYVTQTDDVLDFSAVGGVTLNENITILYLPA